MTGSKLRLLSVCSVILGVMVFSAATAHAEVGAKWLLAKNELGTPLIPFLEATVAFETDTPFVLHAKIAGIAVLFLCTTTSSQGVVLKANGSIGEGARFILSGCTVDLNGVTSKPCEPNNEGKEPGVLKTKPFHGLLVLHELAGGAKDDLILILPDNVGGVKSEIFATLEMSAECAIGTKVNIIGHKTFKDCENIMLVHTLRHLLEIGPLTQLWVISKTAEHVATVLGSWWAKLTGAHAGLLWGGDPA
jgi:hypothetical protein